MTAKLKLPPGFYKNGTEYMSAGRYSDGDLIRWHNDTIVPINGWQIRVDFVTKLALPPLWGDGAATEAARSGIVLGDATSGVNTFIGSNKHIYHISNTNVVTDVTPAAFTTQPKHAGVAGGYGTFRYSYGKYGTPRPKQQGNLTNVFSWGFAEWGFWPLAVARGVGAKPVYVKKDTDADFVAVASSPVGALDIIVTDERFAMTLGSETDFRIVQWSDQEQYTVWTSAINNQAGSYRLAGTGKLLCAVKLLNQILIVGENDAFSGRYVGPPYVYGFGRVGNNCGIIGPEAIAVTEQFAAWLGTLSFWIFDGTVKQLPCEVLDFYLKDHDQSQRSKTEAFTLADYSEIWWLYQSKAAAFKEPDSYIVFNYAKQVWYTGRISRTLGIGNNPLAYPLMVSPGGHVYDHEVPSAGRDSRIPFISTGPLELENGKRLLGLAYIYPDEQLDGDVLMELNVRDMPKMPVRYSRQFTLSSPTSTQGVMGRDIRMKLYGSGANPNWVIGDFRVEPLEVGTPRR